MKSAPRRPNIFLRCQQSRMSYKRLDAAPFAVDPSGENEGIHDPSYSSSSHSSSSHSPSSSKSSLVTSDGSEDGRGYHTPESRSERGDAEEGDLAPPTENDPCLEERRSDDEDNGGNGEAEMGRTCRICFLGPNEALGDLISPCECRGNSRWIHCACLNRWRQAHPAGDRRRSRCEVCRATFTVSDRSASLLFWKRVSVGLVMVCVVANISGAVLCLSQPETETAALLGTSAVSTGTALARGWVVRQAFPDIPLSVLWCSRVDPSYAWKIATTVLLSYIWPVAGTLLGSFFLHADMSSLERLAEDQYCLPPVV